MTRLTLTPILLLAVALGSCSDRSATGPVDIRVRNASEVVMRDIVVVFPDDGGEGSPVEPGNAESGEVAYGTVEPGAVTPHRTIARAYRYARVTLTVDGEEKILQPTDYVGESLLKPGRYTYELRYDGGALGLTLAKD